MTEAWRVAWCLKRSLIQHIEDYLTHAEATTRYGQLNDGTRDVVLYRIDLEVADEGEVA